LIRYSYWFNHLSRNHELEDQNKKRLAEVDVLLENGEYAMAVEVKTHLTTEDVKDHVKRMGILRRVADEHGDRRKYLGAVAGAVIDQEVSAYAAKSGFYVISPSGETVDIEIPEGFKARIW
jgi:enamine deaminase RidA (YjgF/YER057c/UK114 family)